MRRFLGILILGLASLWAADSAAALLGQAQEPTGARSVVAESVGLRDVPVVDEAAVAQPAPGASSSGITVAPAAVQASPFGLPSVVTPAIDWFTSNSVHLSWNEPASDGGSPVLDYVVQFRRVGDPTWGNWFDGYGTSRFTTISGLRKGTEYMFRVGTTNLAGTSYLETSAIDAAGTHTCALISDGTTRCWGHNGGGRLGDGTESSSPVPVDVKGLAGATQIAGGGGHVCALITDGSVKCWGNNGAGQLGNGSLSWGTILFDVNGLSGATQITAGSEHTCALIDDGGVVCWGRNSDGRLGNGATSSHESSPVKVQDINGAVSVSAGYNHTCALIADGTVKCWGDNSAGQLGDGSLSQSVLPVTVTNLVGVSQIESGAYHTCALLTDKTVKCWGANYYGQLGDGTFASRTYPSQVVELGSVQAITAGEGHTCAVLTNMTAKCWGQNGRGQLGDGSNANRTSPFAVAGMSQIKSISAGWLHTCALLNNRTTKCWGWNEYGQLGDGTYESQYTSQSEVDVVRYPTVIPSSLPGAPAVSAESASSDTLRVSWTIEDFGGSAIEDYRVQYRATSSSTWVNQNGISASSGALVTGLDPDSYQVRVAAQNALGLGEWGYSEVATLNPVSAAGSVHITSIETTSTSVTIQWEPPIDTGGGEILDYLIEYRPKGSGTWKNFDDGVSPQNAALITGLTTGTEYEFRILALNASTQVSGLAELDLGNAHSCALTDRGKVKCWGYNNAGESGIPGGLNQLEAAEVAGLENVVSISTGESHSCAQLNNGRIKCWGYNGSGQLGDRSNTSTATPVYLADLDKQLSLAPGGDHACALGRDGQVQCWGTNGYGQLGDGTYWWHNYPKPVKDLGNTIAIDSGWGHSCALLGDRTVRCWGRNEAGQLGDGTTINRNAPVQVVGLSDVKAIDAGGSHTCALLSDGTVRCWGRNEAGQLGDGSTVTRTGAVEVSGLGGVVAISVGSTHTCALINDGTVKCWGWNGYGQLGTGGGSSSSPAIVAGLTGVSRLATGGAHTCALLLDHTVTCWGYNGNGQLGDGTTFTRTTPSTTKMPTGNWDYISATPAGLPGETYFALQVVGSDTISVRCTVSDTGGLPIQDFVFEISDDDGATWTSADDGISPNCSYSFTALDGNGTYLVRVAAVNEKGQGEWATSEPIGIAQLAAPVVPRITEVTADSVGLAWDLPASDGGSPITDYVVQYRAVDAGSWTTFADGVGTSRSVLVTGLTKGQKYAFRIGVKNRAGTSWPSEPAITAGGSHTCALMAEGTAKCWGNNYYGQLGDGTTTNALTPVTVTGLAGATAITAGGSHTCALLADGTVKCWGYNGEGRLGDGSSTSTSTPVAVTGLSGVTAISAGGSHTCALLTDTTVKCWGNNGDGRLGDGTTSNRLTPITVIGLTGATAITADSFHTCALLANGMVKCWGNNGYGRLGDGTTSNRAEPVPVTGLTGATDISAGGSHTCALLSDETVKCWGYNGYGQIGDGTYSNRISPVTVPNLPGVAALSLGGNHTCARMSDGTGMCWGYGLLGQLGNGTSNYYRVAPTVVSGLADLSNVTAGDSHTCSLVADDTARCWGNNGNGQLGDGSTNRALVAIQVQGLSLPGYPTATPASFPGPVSGFRAQQIGSQLRLFWDVSDDGGSAITDFAIRYSADNGLTWADLADGISAIPQLDLSQLPRGATYLVRVAALNAIGASTWTTSAPIRNALTPDLIQPKVLSVTATAVTLSWSPPISDGGSPVTDYVIEYRPMSGGDWQIFTDGVNRKTQVTITGLTQGSEYIFRVSPKNLVGVSRGLVQSYASSVMHSCAALSDGKVSCWGTNERYRLGRPISYQSKAAPSWVRGITNATSVAVSYYHSCSVLSTGSVKCWGDNSSGQLGIGYAGKWSPRPQTVLTQRRVQLQGATQVVALSDSTCALMADGTVRCWGNGSNLTLGNGGTASSPYAKTVSGLTGVRSLSAGAFNICALLANGTVKCWGQNLGTEPSTASARPAAIPGIASAVQISASSDHTCATLANGQISCWGWNGHGGLGDGTTTKSATPMVVPGISGVAEVFAGNGFTCVVLQSGSAKCWGYNADGQLGDGTRTNSLTPVNVAGFSDLAGFMQGGLYGNATAKRQSGDLVTWGGLQTVLSPYLSPYSPPVADEILPRSVNTFDWHLYEAATPATTPLAPTGLSGTAKFDVRQFSWTPGSDGGLPITDYVIEVSGNGGTTWSRIDDGVSTTPSHTVSGLTLGSTYLVRVAAVNALGTGAWVTSAAFVQASPPSAVTPTVSTVTGTTVTLTWSAPTDTGGSAITDYVIQYRLATSSTWLTFSDGVSTALTATVTGLTRDLEYQFRIGTKNGVGTTWVEIVQFATGGHHSCALFGDGTVKCWGYNGHGQLGDGTTVDRSLPVAVSGLKNVVQISLGLNHSCAVLANTQVRCWGDNGSGQLGMGTQVDQLLPVPVIFAFEAVPSPLTKVSSIAAGDQHTCALLAGGGVACWGSNQFGQIGAGTSGGYSGQPYVIPSITGATVLSTGTGHTCALLSDGTMKCWGGNASGQIGDNSSTGRPRPTTVLNLTTATAITAAGDHTCATLVDGTAKCWGANAYGQLGDGTATTRQLPNAVPGLTGVASISASASHTCTMQTNGTVKCWGYNGYGQIGDGGTTTMPQPVQVPGLTGVASISTGRYHTCTLQTDGTAKCWGSNEFGQLGDGTTIDRSSPTAASTVNNSLWVSATTVYVPTAPRLTSFSPTSGGRGTAVLLTGSGFADVTTVRLGTLSIPFAVVSDTQIVAKIPSGAATGSFTVVNSAGSGTSATTFRVTTTVATRTITTVTPTTVSPGGEVTVTGTNMGAATAVTVGGLAATFRVTAINQFIITMPANAVDGKIVATTAAGTVTSTATVYLPPRPTTMSPTAGGAGSILTFTGENLASVTQVSFNGINATPTAKTATTLTVAVPAAAASGPVWLVSPGGSSASFEFTKLPSPVLNTFTITAKVGDIVTLTGANLGGVLSITVGTTPVVLGTVTAASTEVRFAVPAGAVTGKVTITTIGGTVTSTSALTVLPAPKITRMTPVTGKVGTVVTITGTNLTGASVTVGGVTAVISSNTATSLKFRIPAGLVAGKYEVLVTTPNGSATISFTVA